MRLAARRRRGSGRRVDRRCGPPPPPPDLTRSVFVVRVLRAHSIQSSSSFCRPGRDRTCGHDRPRGDGDLAVGHLLLEQAAACGSARPRSSRPRASRRPRRAARPARRRRRSRTGTTRRAPRAARATAHSADRPRGARGPRPRTGRGARRARRRESSGWGWRPVRSLRTIHNPPHRQSRERWAHVRNMFSRKTLRRHRSRAAAEPRRVPRPSTPEPLLVPRGALPPPRPPPLPQGAPPCPPGGPPGSDQSVRAGRKPGSVLVAQGLPSI